MTYRCPEHGVHPWPPPLHVGQLVYPLGVSCPDTGEIVALPMRGKYARVKWASRPWHTRYPISKLGCVCATLTADAYHRQGRMPCPTARCTSYLRDGEAVCWLCASWQDECARSNTHKTTTPQQPGHAPERRG